MVFELFDGATGKADGTLEVLSITFGQLDKSLQGRDVGTVGGLGDGALVFVVVVLIVVGTDVEETVALQMDILVNFKV